MQKQYRCDRCKSIFKTAESDKFIVGTLQKCPSCGSTQVALHRGKKATFAKDRN